MCVVIGFCWHSEAKAEAWASSNANEKVFVNGVEINECVIIYTKMNNVRIN